ncbi:hypothetical protein [Aurantibacillus circumpalustris]|uniref:hypothetical protein n=1 Tax=Aurantibacillus circumpalustris TaxID=3036359 RepID=UPI00295B8B68|nr:hypothetical protein [Aurantibacillus circumpalustris]
MSKKILVLYYTQSGQLADILNSFVSPLVKAGHSIETLEIHPQIEYPFPWTSKQFFSVMPDCVLGAPTELKPFQLKETKYDLIVLGYQAWFLSPSIPINSALNDSKIRAVLNDTPVITVTGARNMWISALERVKQVLKETNAKHVGNIALVDKHHNLISVITILYWMFTAKRDKFLGLFPKPGVSDADIEHTRVFGALVDKHLSQNDWNGLQDELFVQKSVVVNYNLMYTESKATRLFGIWANFIVKRKNRGPWLVVFKYYLIIALFIAAPIILTINTIFFKPFLRTKTKKQLAYYAGIN